MALPKLPRRWATNTNYSTGVDAGQPTKVDPVSDANGFIPDVGIAAAHVNYLLGALNDGVRGAVTRQALHTCNMGTAFTNEAAVAAVPLGTVHGSGMLVIKSGALNVLRLSDSGAPESVGAVASITSLVTGAANSAGRIVAIGTGGNNNCFSTNAGVSWTAGGAIGAVPNDIVWNPTHSRFLVSRSTTTVSFSADATAWSTGTASLDSCNSGIAVLPNGDTIVCGLDNGDGNDPAFSRSTNGGTSWADSGGTVPNASTYTEAGWVSGPTCGSAIGSRILHVGRRSSNATLTVCGSTDGTNWSVLNEWTPTGGVNFSTGRPRIMLDPLCSGFGVIVAPINGLGQAIAYATLDFGDTWSDPVTVASSTIAAYAVAGGRFVSSFNAAVFVSAGVSGTLGWS